MKVLITGANGMLGQEVVNRAEELSYDFCALNHSELDIVNTREVNGRVGDIRPQAIINCAAYTKVDACEQSPEIAEQVNSIAPGILANAAEKHGATLVHISTDYVFDGMAESPYTEKAPTAPLSVYGSSKLKGEEVVRNSGAKHFIIRTCGLYGAHGTNFVDTMASIAIGDETVSVVTDQRTTPTHAETVAEAIFALLSNPESGLDREHTGLYHVAATGSCTWHECARLIFEAMGAQPARVLATTSCEFGRPAPRPAYAVLSTDLRLSTIEIELPAWDDKVRDYLKSTRLGQLDRESA